MWPTHVRCAIGTIDVCFAMRSVIAIVRSRVVPPAPYVTETNVGCSGSSSRRVRHSSASPSASFGGKNSKENERCPAPMSSGMRTGWAGMGKV